MKKLIALFAVATFLTGCNAEVTDFVKGAIKNPVADLPSLPITPSSPPGPSTVKVSPGQFRASAANGAVVANVTPTNQVMKSSDISARVGISRNRVSNQ